jgi:nicotinate-nucleotide adenylyltransferase
MTPASARRVAVFGGTFDPVHVGHLIVAEQCREQARLDEVWFVPAARPPHKPEGALTPFDRRVEMLELAVAGRPDFRVDEIERELPGPSYTAETLADLAARRPNTDLHFILGADSLTDLPQWREPARILELATILAVGRPGWTVPPADELCSALKLVANAPLRVQVIQSPLIEISSRDLRRRVALGRSLRYLVPRAIEVYIQNHRLYQGE